MVGNLFYGELYFTAYHLQHAACFLWLYCMIYGIIPEDYFFTGEI